MKTVYKYELAIADEQTLSIHSGFIPLSVQVQNGTPCLWCTVDTEREIINHKILMYGTGRLIEKAIGHHIGSFQMLGGAAVFHVFDSLDNYKMFDDLQCNNVEGVIHG